MGEKRTHSDTMDAQITASEYEAFQKRTCVRPEGFTSMYYTLGLVEESAEVLEVVRGNASKMDLVKECGDVLWYATGLLRNHSLPLNEYAGEKFEAVEPLGDAGDHGVQLMMTVGALAGRLKKFERGDYGEEKLTGFVKDLVPQVFASLQAILAAHGKGLHDAAECNRSKIEKRFSTGTVTGDGSNRESTGVEKCVSAGA
eukprot:TRINITY_DN31935_c0_g1_i1.p2 TRINITY_DN31935_c0_g1~~TRINITY_DN31935_c0_g1_i1.p2  ORF type:complete len:216 (+),score=57.35 TRINITY_DN31935_c0_g1_i1:51-650(+)